MQPKLSARCRLNLGLLSQSCESDRLLLKMAELTMVGGSFFLPPSVGTWFCKLPDVNLSCRAEDDCGNNDFDWRESTCFCRICDPFRYNEICLRLGGLHLLRGGLAERLTSTLDLQGSNMMRRSEE